MTTFGVIPHATAPFDPAGRCVIVVDTLRASSTIIAMLDAGVRRVYAVRDLAAAYALRDALGPGTLLCGERDSRPPEGFDLGNSPVALAGRRFDGTDAVITTTNGAVALERAAPAATVIVGALTNAHAAVEAALATGLPVAVLCAGEAAGTVPATEDTYAAGFMARLALESASGVTLTPVARDALASYARAGDPAEALATAPHGRALVDAGFAADVAFCAGVGTSRVVPILRRDERGQAYFAMG